jgi:hypothetical protein
MSASSSKAKAERRTSKKQINLIKMDLPNCKSSKLTGI